MEPVCTEWIWRTWVELLAFPFIGFTGIGLVIGFAAGRMSKRSVIQSASPQPTEDA